MRERLEQAVDLMVRFAERTGVTGAHPPRRYLWTDAFAVCTFLELSRLTGEGRYRDLALALVDQVHRVLGRHRADDPRTGWLSGLGPTEGEAHPTRGGLRIGKPLPERGPAEPADERREWDRDGQYFHYLTKWMHALDQTSRATRQPLFNVWARELAAVAHRAFVRSTPTGARMDWKMSIDLSWAQVAAMGQHDPVDGYVTCRQLEATARAVGAAAEPSLAAATADFDGMVRGQSLATADPLGLGGLLSDADRVAQLGARAAGPGDARLLDALLEGADVGLTQYLTQPDLRLPAHHRLAFRELGLAIGLAAVERLQDRVRGGAERVAAGAAGRAALARCARVVGVRGVIEAFWLDPEHHRGPTWLEHQDINEVMLAATLVPDGFLGLEGLG